MKFNAIEKNIPVPNKYYSSQYPFNQLEVGDSILIEPENVKESIKLYNRIKSYSSIWGKRHNKTLRIRAQKEGIRVWRIN